jgi:nitric oxide reductase large subunit
MSAVVLILAVGYTTIGQFYGFSLLLGVSVTIAVASLFWRFEPQKKVPEGKGT